MEERRVSCHTFAEILEMVHASACRILLIDAEGADCEILQSMGEFCNARPQSQRWPWIILFETRGYANTRQSPKQEEETVRQLQLWGYDVVYSGGDTLLLHNPTISSECDFRLWADKTFTLACVRCNWKTWPSKNRVCGCGSAPTN